MTPTLEKPKLNPEDLQPVNNIYEVSIHELSALKCLDGEIARGFSETTTLAQGDTPQKAKDYLRDCWEFTENYVKHTEEQRRKGKPFRLDETKQPERVLYCERRFQNSRRDFTCGKPRDGETLEYDQNALNGEFGGCVIQGYDIPDFFENRCPYQIQQEIASGKLKLEEIQPEYFI